MKLAIMQPYFFPYLGYFQLIDAVDAFVIYDDVNYRKSGWINRNYILDCSGKTKVRLTLSVQKASSNKLIKDISLVGKSEKLLKTIRQNYRKAPHFAAVFPLVEFTLGQGERNLARFLEIALRMACDYLGQQPKWYLSSSLDKDDGLRGQEKVLAICQLLGATHYVNLPGVKALYDANGFEEKGIQLSFIEPKPVSYWQFEGEFVPDLSILDVLMFNDQSRCSSLLREYDLV